MGRAPPRAAPFGRFPDVSDDLPGGGPAAADLDGDLLRGDLPAAGRRPALRRVRRAPDGTAPARKVRRTRS